MTTEIHTLSLHDALPISIIRRCNNCPRLICITVYLALFNLASAICYMQRNNHMNQPHNKAIDVVYVDVSDLPVYCPGPNSQIWWMHPSAISTFKLCYVQQ